ncbi:MAG: tyrosine-type recombinase/integrase [Acidimicrobiales bacterium]
MGGCGGSQRWLTGAEPGFGLLHEPGRVIDVDHAAGRDHQPVAGASTVDHVEGPIFLGGNGERLDRHAAWRIVRRLARRAGINKPVGPHTLRHAFITAALDAGAPLRDVQEAASHADPRTTMRYDRARVSLDRHATYIVAAFLAGAAR